MKQLEAVGVVFGDSEVKDGVQTLIGKIVAEVTCECHLPRRSNPEISQDQPIILLGIRIHRIAKSTQI